MDEFNGINTFFNMIYHNDRAFSRALLNYQSFNDYRQWLRNHHIEFKELDIVEAYIMVEVPRQNLWKGKIDEKKQC